MYHHTCPAVTCSHVSPTPVCFGSPSKNHSPSFPTLQSHRLQLSVHVSQGYSFSSSVLFMVCDYDNSPLSICQGFSSKLHNTPGTNLSYLVFRQDDSAASCISITALDNSNQNSTPPGRFQTPYFSPIDSIMAFTIDRPMPLPP